MAREAREKIVKITRRLDTKWYTKFLITFGAIVVAFLACSLLMFVVYPQNYLAYYSHFFIEIKANLIRLIKDSAFLFLIAIALTPVFKMKYWNIGAEGQCLMGVLGSIIVMKFMAPNLNIVIAILLELVFAVLFSVIWTVIPAIFKAFFNTNETLFTLMMNYISYGIVSAFVLVNKTTTESIDPLWTKENELYGHLPFEKFFNGYPFVVGIIIVVAIIVMIYLKYSKHGYELSVVGGSQNTAKYVGINVKKVIIRTAILTGAICGIVGFLIGAGINYTVSANSIHSNGFTAIIICWLGNFSVPAMAFYAALITFVASGCSGAIDWGASNGDLGTAVSGMEKIAVGLFFIILIISTFLINFKVTIKLPKKKAEIGGMVND